MLWLRDYLIKTLSKQFIIAYTNVCLQIDSKSENQIQCIIFSESVSQEILKVRIYSIFLETLW